MVILRVSLFLLLAFAVGADKKIELQDIEDDNLKSEKQKDIDYSDPSSEEADSASIPLDVLKSGFVRYFQRPPAIPQQPRYVQQYDVTEPPIEESKNYNDQPGTQPDMVGYVSNVPIEVYLVPRYYNEPQESSVKSHSSQSYSNPTAAHDPSYQETPKALHGQTNYVEAPAYVTPTGKTYLQEYSQPVAYVGYSAHSGSTAAHPTAAPVVSYKTPVQYTTAVETQHHPSKEYVHNYHSNQYTDTNAIDEVQEIAEQHHQEYPTHTQIIYHKSPKPEYTDPLYSSRLPQRHSYQYNHIAQVPHTSSIVYKAPVQHTPQLPKVLPIQRPFTKVYTSGDPFVSQPFSYRPPEPYHAPFHRRPTSLLDSYIPSSVQIEYLKRGFAKDPLEAYEALSSGRHLHSALVAPRHFERGFLPNQMYHTAAGGVTFGHYKRSPKLNTRLQQ